MAIYMHRFRVYMLPYVTMNLYQYLRAPSVHFVIIILVTHTLLLYMRKITMENVQR